jgi:hypothetical protein
MNTRIVPVIYGSVRTDRQGIKAAHFVVKELERPGYHAVLVDPLERRIPLLDRSISNLPRVRRPRFSGTWPRCS